MKPQQSNSLCRISLLLGGVLLWALLTWPLLPNMGRAIPMHDRITSPAQSLIELEPGDHLQLYYHFWLARDMLAGHTPAFNNIYEFNLGEAAAAPRFDPYYAPFSLVFAALSPWLGDAAGWNLAGLASVLLGLWGTFLLVRRYATNHWLAAAIALLATAFPYRWITLACGSPTGYGIGLVPWLFAGLDMAIRDRRPLGGLAAGLALLGCYGSDLHCFYFSALATPLWSAVVWSTSARPFDLSRQRLWRTFLALLPTLLLAILALGLSQLASRQLDSSTMSAGRTLDEIELYSPIRSGLLRWQHLGASNHIYIGRGLLLLLLLGFALQLLPQRWRSPNRAPAAEPEVRRGLLLWLVVLGISAVVLVAFGTYGPLHALPLRAARRLLPRFTMIRQTTKLFLLMPTLIAILLALLYAIPLQWQCRKRRLLLIAFTTLGLLTIAEYSCWLKVGLCLLPPNLPAYSAAADHARSHNIDEPRAVAIPLWPGDSHYSSLYEYGITRSRLRLLNGYAPAVPTNYIETVSDRLYSLNQGVVTPAQLDLLRSMSVHYLLFHEQPYPEKVSPFPAAIALRQLYQHPWLEPLAATDAIHAFALRQTPRPAAAITSLWGPPHYFPAFHWWLRSSIAPPRDYKIMLRKATPFMPAQRFLLRLEGHGTLLSWESGTTLAATTNSTWVTAPMSPPYGDHWHVTAGAPLLQDALIIAGDDPMPDSDNCYHWLPADGFHAGATDIASGSVLLDPHRTPPGRALRLPNRPLPPGRYRATLTTEALASETLRDGDWLAATSGANGLILAISPVTPGTPATCEFAYDGLLPLNLEYHYHRKTSLKLLAVELQLVTPPQSVTVKQQEEI